MASPNAAEWAPVVDAGVLPGDAPAMLTMGYVAPGVEMVVHAMALLRREHPDLHYVVAGRTHPDVARRDGERYRWSLEALADDLGLAERLHFLDRSLGVALHESLIARCDVVVVPYRLREHAPQRTVLGAVNARRPVIVTKPCAPLAARGATITIDVDADEECAAAIDHVLKRVSPATRVGVSKLAARRGRLTARSGRLTEA